MNIQDLFSTEERVRILKNVIFRMDEISVSKLAANLKLSKGLVSKIMNFLVKEKIARTANKKFVIEDNIMTKAVKIFLSLDRIDASLFEKYRFVKAAGLYGSAVNGSNTEESDIDMWIFVSNASDHTLAGLTHKLTKRYGNVKPLYLTKEKILELKKKDILFYHSLVFGSISIYGGDILGTV